MFKCISAVALLGVASTASAFEFGFLDSYNYVMESAPVYLVRGVADYATGSGLREATPKFTTCVKKEVTGDFQPDISNTYLQPATVLKGIETVLTFSGLMTEDVEVTNIQTVIELNNSPLHIEDHLTNKHVAANELFTESLSWTIPSYAPSGRYDVVVSVEGKVLGTSRSEYLGCVNASFDF